MPRVRTQRNSLLARAAGTVGVMAVALGATITPANAAGHPTDIGEASGNGSTDVTPDTPTATGTTVSVDGDQVHIHQQQARVQAAMQAHARRQALVTAVIPAPTGHYQVGTTSLHLIDQSRYDPWVPSHPRRELMVQIWYPATNTAGLTQAPWLPSEAANSFLRNLGAWPGTVALPTTAGFMGAQVDPAAGKLPVLLYSTGLHSDRSMGTTLAEDLASRGYLVVAIDHTHDANEVQFPDGRLETNSIPANATNILTVRAADVHFVINELAAIQGGTNPDVDKAPLPTGLTHNIDMSRIGMFGWSEGGAAVATSMQLDSRIAAGANLDGQFYGSAYSKDLNRPFLLFSSQSHNRDTDGSWRTFWSHLKGPRYDIKMAGAAHLSFSDFEVLLPQAASVLGISQYQLQQEVGTINPSRAILVQRTYLAAYFDTVLRGQHSTLMDGPSTKYPEISFVR